MDLSSTSSCCFCVFDKKRKNVKSHTFPSQIASVFYSYDTVLVLFHEAKRLHRICSGLTKCGRTTASPVSYVSYIGQCVSYVCQAHIKIG